ncbi:hypothetical protein NQ318_008778 [Aromia moschata]|uniref:EF-hand domain-containing family member C2 n=1 Tax=Aromia moschata TaxID=1265417 RepID=A0AAV8ZBY4_9CUCU|nr:hypothetical protein NQ318_008778 [Aromia moschata]
MATGFVKTNATLAKIKNSGANSGVLILRYIIDPLDCGREDVDYYTEKDLSIGGVLNCYGRRIVLTDCDSFTREYYSSKYGISEFTPIPIPDQKKDEREILPPRERELPPWNGYGSYEDSAQNCITVEPKAPHRDFKKFLMYDRTGLDSHILRFEARMRSKIPENCDRIFVISYYLADDTISVFEIARNNSGFKTSMFLRRGSVQLPGQKVFTSKPPLCYTPQHMFVGAMLIITGYEFILIDADEYALRYMELNPGQFPKADIKRIMGEVRETLKPIYRDFVAENIPKETPVITYEKLREKLCKIMGPEFTEHEMITISRAFSATCYKDRFNRERIREIALTELKRYLWDDLERLHEYFLQRDANKSGKLSKKDCYTVIKACRLPFDNELIDRILEVTRKDEQCNLYYEDIIQFLDRKNCPMGDVPPINIKHDLWWGAETPPPAGALIDWCAFNKYLDLEDTFKEEITEGTVKAFDEKHKTPALK